MTDPTDPKEALAVLAAATTRYAETEAAHERSREQAIASVVAALKAGATPTEVTRTGPFTDAYVRKLAREAGIPPARSGIKPGTPKSKANKSK